MCCMPLKHQENVTTLAPLLPTQHPSSSTSKVGLCIWISCKYSSWFLLLFIVLCLTLQPHGLQHVRLPCPSLSPRVCSNSCPFSWWCHTTTSSSVIPFSSCPQSFSASGSFPMGWLFTAGGQRTEASAWASISLSSEYSGLISFKTDCFFFFKWRSWL